MDYMPEIIEGAVCIVAMLIGTFVFYIVFKSAK